MSTESNEDVMISRGATVEGKIACPGTVRVAGNVKGEINCTNLVVHAGGMIDGSVACTDAKISGSVSSEITAEDLIFVDSTGKLSGKCSYGQLEIAKGGLITGDLLPINSKKKKVVKKQESDDGDEEETATEAENSSGIMFPAGTF